MSDRARARDARGRLMPACVRAAARARIITGEARSVSRPRRYRADWIAHQQHFGSTLIALLTVRVST